MQPEGTEVIRGMRRNSDDKAGIDGWIQTSQRSPRVRTTVPASDHRPPGVSCAGMAGRLRASGARESALQPTARKAGKTRKVE